MKGHYPNLGRKPPDGDSAARHPSSHHSDASGAHVRGTHHHLSNAHHTGDSEGKEGTDHTLQMGETMPEPGAEMKRSRHGTVERGASMPGGPMETAEGPGEETA